MKIKKSLSSLIFDGLNVTLMLSLLVIMLYPFVYVGAASLSDSAFISNGDVVFFPKGFTIEGYKRVLSDHFVLLGYMNTIKYTVIQTIITLFFTALTAYPLSKSRLMWKRQVLMFIGFTMLFSGGLIPQFLVIKSLGMYNTMWAIIIPGAVNTFYLFIMRTFFEGIPMELDEAATLDGCTPFGVFIRIVLPLSKPVMVTVALFTAVSQWNSFFQALIYMTDKELYPLQIHLRNIVIAGSAASQTESSGDEKTLIIMETVKYATIMVAVLPIICVYPFIQKYFVQGAMIGGIKG